MSKAGVGDIYVQTLTFADINAKRAETKSLTLASLRIWVTGNTCKIGRQGKQDFLLTKNDSYYSNYYDPLLVNIDLADLWFKPTSTSTVVHLLGTTKD